ncbi:MAG: Gfo/Idh/MocA family oxidoreductase [Proteobacteria bacterium]|nr:Gfo/Idh/MocA family oxidoreductase [Pseudomonadota bacterium]
MRVLIAGLGAVGQRHARNLRALGGAELDLLAFRQRGLRHVVTAGLERDATRDAEEEFGIRSFTDLDAALAQRPDAVFVCTTTDRHLEIAQRAADAGCHLFIEKPLALTLQGVDELRATVLRNGLVAAIGCQWRFHPCARQLFQLIDAGLLGRIVQAEIEYAEYLPDWHKYEDYRVTWPARAELGGGVVLAHIHDYDLAHWLFGAARRVRASGGKLSDLELEVEDTVDATIETAQATVRVRQTFASRAVTRRITVTGERHAATADLVAGTVRTAPALASSMDRPDYDRNEMFLAEVTHFLAAVERREEPVVPLDDGIAVLCTALAVKESMRTGATIELAGT